MEKLAPNWKSVSRIVCFLEAYPLVVYPFCSQVDGCVWFQFFGGVFYLVGFQLLHEDSQQS